MARVPEPNGVGLVQILRQVVRHPLLPDGPGLKCSRVVEFKILLYFLSLLYEDGELFLDFLPTGPLLLLVCFLGRELLLLRLEALNLLLQEGYSRIARNWSGSRFVKGMPDEVSERGHRQRQRNPLLPVEFERIQDR